MAKKLVISIAAVVTFAVVASLYYVGVKTEEEIKQALGKESELMPPNVSISLDSYERGWLSSSAKTTLVANSESGAQQPLVFEHTIKHGPMLKRNNEGFALAAIVSTFTPSETIKEVSSHYFNEQSPLSIVTFVGFDGEIASNITVPSYNGRSHADDADIVWRGLHGSATYLDNAFSFEIEVPRWHYTNKEEAIKIEDIVLSAQQKISENGLAVGEFDFTVETLSANEIEGQAFYLRGHSKDQGGVAGFELKTGMSGFELANESGSGTVEMIIEKLDSPALAEMQKDLGPEKLAGLIPELLKHSPELRIQNTRFETSEGVVLLKLLALFDAAQGVNLQAPASLFLQLMIDGELSMPVTIAEKIAASVVRDQIGVNRANLSDEQFAEHVSSASKEMLANLETSKLIIREQDRYLLSVKFKEGALLLNGEPANLPPSLFSM